VVVGRFGDVFSQTFTATWMKELMWHGPTARSLGRHVGSRSLGRDASRQSAPLFVSAQLWCGCRHDEYVSLLTARIIVHANTERADYSNNNYETSYTSSGAGGGGGGGGGGFMADASQNNAGGGGRRVSVE
jgi:hypothetical protein